MVQKEKIMHFVRMMLMGDVQVTTCQQAVIYNYEGVREGHASGLLSVEERMSSWETPDLFF